jgi:hypothetical protein
MQATVVITQNPFHPAKGRVVRTYRRRRNLERLARQVNGPFVCIYNGAPVLRAERQRISLRDGDVVNFIALPQGGGGGDGGKNVLRIVAMIAVVYFTAGLGGALLGIEGAALVGGFGVHVANALVTAAALALVDAVLPAPKPPAAQRMAQMAAPSPTYNLQAQGNAARLGSAIPVQYGRHIAYPDFAAEPYAEFAGNEQYLYQLFCIGQGWHSLEQIRIEDTPITSFEEIEYEWVDPGGSVTLFPTNVITSAEVSGAEAVTGVYLGPFVATPAGTDSNYIAVDMVCPRGLYLFSGGSFAQLSATFRVEVRLIDNSGAPLGAWATLATETITAATNTPQRKSFRYSVTAGRYEVRLIRTDTKDESTSAGHELNWAGLRAFVPGSQAYGNVTMLAVRARATNNLSQTSSRKINVISTRMLPIWNGTTWSAPTATRSIAWALADAARNTDYGARLADSGIALDELLALDAVWTARGDTFDARFDNASTFWEALQKIARAGRAKPYQQSGLLHVTRDQEQTTPVAMFTPRNTVRGTLKIDYLMPTPETADAVEVEFFNEELWATDTVTASLPGSTESVPAKVQLFGVTNRDQAWREGMYIAACNRYRRKPIVLNTEMEGFIPSYGDLVSIASERLTAAQYGEIVAWDATTRTVTTSEPLSWGVGTHYFAFRKRDGGFDGPYVATAGVNDHQAILAQAPAHALYVGSRAERTHYSFGIATEYRQLAILIGARPRGNQVELQFINEYIDGDGQPYVHYADQGTPPTPIEAWQLPRLFETPSAPTGLAVSETLVEVQGIVRSRMDVSWDFNATPESYVVDYRYGDADWVRIGETKRTSISQLDPQLGEVEIRVIAVAGSRTSEPTTITTTLLGKTAPPADVKNFRIDAGTLYWDDGTELDLAGYEVRFNYGTNLWWDTATPLHTDLIVASPWTPTVSPSGSVTLMIKAKDTSGNYSDNAAYIITQLGDQIVSNVLEQQDEHTGFTGTKTGCTVVGGELVADTTDVFYGPDAEPFYGADTEDFYPASTYSEMVYEWFFDVPAGLAGSGNYLVLSHDIGGSFTIEYKRDDQSPFYGIDGDFFYGADADSLFGADGAWQTWPGSVEVVGVERIYFRITVQAGAMQGVIATLSSIIDVPDVTETVDDFVVDAGGARLPITKVYRVIKNVQITIQDDGNDAVNVKIMDKNATLGPLVQGIDAANLPVQALVDATVQGY